jgi:hypothetical protein
MEKLKVELPDGTTIVGRLEQDQDCPNPCEDCDGVGHIRSLSRRHVNNISFEEAKSLLETDAMVVALSYYEHGQCLWDVVGGKRIGRCPDQQWDQVDFAGVWVPDDCCRDEIKSRSHRKHITYQAAAQELAAECCRSYTDWSNGECYGHVVKAFDPDGNECEDDSCWGYIGYEYAISQLQEQFDYMVKQYSQVNNAACLI